MPANESCFPPAHASIRPCFVSTASLTVSDSTTLFLYHRTFQLQAILTSSTKQPPQRQFVSLEGILNIWHQKSAENCQDPELQHMAWDQMLLNRSRLCPSNFIFLSAFPTIGIKKRKRRRIKWTAQPAECRARLKLFPKKYKLWEIGFVLWKLEWGWHIKFLYIDQ